jgi:hypothetical protein
VTIRRGLHYDSIDVNFADSHFHRNLSLNNEFRCSMACLNYSGLLLAS